jgi:hypothetical protein
MSKGRKSYGISMKKKRDFIHFRKKPKAKMHAKKEEENVAHYFHPALFKQPE